MLPPRASNGACCGRLLYCGSERVLLQQQAGADMLDAPDLLDAAEDSEFDPVILAIWCALLLFFTISNWMV
jgi:hypothetical protein